MVRWIAAITALATAVTVSTAKPLTGRFIHITDIHYDPTYKAGTDPKQFCHRGKQNEDAGDGAGEYGAVNTDCDSPKKLVDLTFEFLKRNLSDVDFVVYTGDSARHNRDKENPRTLKDVISDQEVVVNYFRDAFGSTPVLPVIGNNDVEPHNNADLNDKQFEAIHNLWQPLNLNMTQDFMKGGFLTHDVIPGKLRTIHTNTLLFMKKNDKTKDCDKLDSPGWAHMSWIRSVLDDARARKMTVYVLAHVPPNNRKDKAYFRDACLEQYYHLLGSYSDVVAAHFAGHYNDDVLTAVLDNNGTYSHATATPSKKGMKGLQSSQKFVTPVFNSPSIIPDNNPAVRVFEYDLDGKHGKFGTITNWKQYYLDLGANTDQEKNDMKYDYKVEYDAKEVYKIEAFDGAGMQKLFETISKDDGVSSKYIEYSTVSTDVDDE